MLVFRRGYEHGIYIPVRDDFIVIGGMDISAGLLRQRLGLGRIGV